MSPGAEGYQLALATYRAACACGWRGPTKAGRAGAKRGLKHTPRGSLHPATLKEKGETA